MHANPSREVSASNPDVGLSQRACFKVSKSSCRPWHEAKFRENTVEETCYKHDSEQIFWRETMGRGTGMANQCFRITKAKIIRK